MATDARPNLVTAPSAWVPAQDDHPWRDEADPCEPAHIVEEYDGVQVIEIDTTACRNQTLTQPLAQSLAAGASLTIVGFHFSLTSTAPATGHFAVALGGNVIVDEKVEIPSPAGGFERIIELDEAVPAGTSVYWHIHNHGANRWILVSFLVQPHGSSSD